MELGTLKKKYFLQYTYALLQAVPLISALKYDLHPT